MRSASKNTVCSNATSMCRYCFHILHDAGGHDGRICLFRVPRYDQTVSGEHILIIYLLHTATRLLPSQALIAGRSASLRFISALSWRILWDQLKSSGQALGFADDKYLRLTNPIEG